MSSNLLPRPYNYGDCDAYDAAHNNAYDYASRLTLTFNASYDCNYDYYVSVNQVWRRQLR